MHILYVEDNPLDADQIVAELARSVPPITVDLAATYARAVAKLDLCTPEQPVYDLVLTDLRLPDGSGLALLPLIRERRLDMAVVVLVGAGNDDLVVSALKAGASDYLLKRLGYAAHVPAALEAALLRHRAEAARHIRPLNVVYVEHLPTDIGLTRQHFAQFAPHIHLGVANLMGDEVLRKLPPPGECDVLLLDYHLPRLNGLELLKDLQQTPRRDLPVVLVMEPGREEIGLQALHLGAMDYIVKNPGYLHKLPMVVENAFDRARLVREQAALKASEAYFRSLVENVSDVITVMNAEGVVHYQSPSVAQVLGYQPDEMIGADGFRLFHLDDVAVARQAIETAFLNPGVASPIGEVRLQHSDGSWRVLDGVGKCQVVNDANWKLVVINWHDVTARKQAEEVLRATKTYVENLIESASAMVIGLDAQGNIQIFNQAAERITGYTRAELADRPWLEVLMPRDRYPDAWAVTTSLAEGVWPRCLECPLLTKAGEERYIAWQTNEIREQGQLVETVLFGMDITDRKRAEAKLADTEKRFRALVEHSEDAIALVSVEGDLLYQSPAAERILGWKGEAWLDHKIFDFIHPEDLSAYQALWSQVAQKPAGGVHGQFRVCHQDGAWRWIELTASDWLTETNAPAMVVNYRDVTEGVMRERELAALVTVSRALRTAQNRKELAVVILDQVVTLLNAEAAALVLRDPVTGGLVLESGSGLVGAPEGQALTGGEQIFEAILASGQPYITNDRAVEPGLAQLGLFDAQLTTLVGIPLIVQKQPLGTLWLGRLAAIGEAEVRLFVAIGNIAANALHRATLHEQTAQYARQMALATQVGQALTETFDLPKIYTCLGQAVRDLLPDIGSVFISLFDGSRNLTSFAYAFADGAVIPPSEYPSVSLGLSGRGPQSEAMVTRRPVITDPVRSRSRPATGVLADVRLSKRPSQSGLYVPMLAQGEAMGVIQVQSYTPNRFNRADAEVLMFLGSTAAAAIENARLFQTTRRQRDELSIVSQVALVTAAHEPFDEAVARATEALKQIWPRTSSLGFMFVDRARAELRLHASYLGVPVATTPPIPLEQGLVGWVARELKPVRAGNVLADRRYVPMTLSTRSQMAAPLVVDGSAIGVINVESPQLDAFSGDDLLLLTALADKLSLLFKKSKQEGKLAAHVLALQRQVSDYVAQLEAANTELLQARQETELANQMRQEFVARLSLALRTPLKAITGQAQAMEADLLTLDMAEAGQPVFFGQSNAGAG
jgi:PAS domain S-box-containing protein